MDRKDLEKKREELQGKSITVPLTSEQVYAVVCAIQIANDMQKAKIVVLHPKMRQALLDFLDITKKCAREQLGITDEMIKGMGNG